MQRFYVWYVQDAGAGLMTCHALIEAESWAVAERDWVTLIRAQGKACHPAFNRYEGLKAVPSEATLEWCDAQYTGEPVGVEMIVERLLGDRDPYRHLKRLGKLTQRLGAWWQQRRGDERELH